MTAALAAPRMSVGLGSERMTERRRRVFRRTTLAIAVVALVAPGAATAQTPGDISGVDQYVEVIPDAGGGAPTGGGRGNDNAGNGPSRLSGTAARELREHGGGDAALLQAIATSRDFGAPGAGLSRSSGSGDTRGGSLDDGAGPRGNGGTGDERSDGSGAAGAAEGIPDVSFGEAITSAVGAMADTEGGGGPSPLLLALLAISAALVTTAAWRARRGPRVAPSRALRCVARR